MSRNFGPGAALLCGRVAQALGWRPAEFWAATPAELASILAPFAQAETAAHLSRRELNQMMERLDD